MGAHVTRTDFEWSYTEEPHATRRKEILAKHPEIKTLFGPDPNLKWVICSMITVQTFLMLLIRDQSWSIVFVTAYCIGGVINHSLMLAIHEISHNLAFGHGKPLTNRIFGMFTNLLIGFPFSVTFKKYHIEHHRYQGDEIRDTDIPTYFEAKLFCTTIGKFFWVLLQPLFYSLRPILTYPKEPTFLEIVNSIVQIIFNTFIYYVIGTKCLVYLMSGSLLAMGLHPVAGHFISEHYMFKKGFETYSYYGSLNWITFNVGYHNEHHDFPYVAGSRLPMVKKMAPEFYDNLPQHNSWIGVLYDFIMDPDIGPYARIKRKNKGLDG